MKVLKKALACLLMVTMLVPSIATPAYAQRGSLRALSINTSGLNKVSGYDFVMDASKMGIDNMQFSTNMSGWTTRNETWGDSPPGRKILAKDFGRETSGEF